MAGRIWYEVWAAGPMESRPGLVAKVKSEGLTRLIAAGLKAHYAKVEVK